MNTKITKEITKLREEYQSHINDWGRLDADRWWNYQVSTLVALVQKETQEQTIKEVKIDHSIDVRYEPDVIKAFDKFIKKWCGGNAPHLLDSDEQDGQFMRDKIEELLSIQGNVTEEEDK